MREIVGAGGRLGDLLVEDLLVKDLLVKDFVGGLSSELTDE